MEDEQLKNRHRQLLKFGDTVLLGGVDLSGCVSATTKLVPQARFETLREGVDVPPEYTECRFQVYHKHQYIERRNLMTTLSACGIDADDHDEDEEEDVFFKASVKELQREKIFQQLEDKDKVLAVKMAFEKEQKVNTQESLRLVGQPVLYGQQVQLMHVTSGLFLTVKKTASDVDRGALKLVLTDGHQGSWFQIGSGYKTKAEGDRVMYTEIVSFSSAAYSGMGLHLSSAQLTKARMLPVEQSPNVVSTLEVTCAPDVTPFKVFPHSLHESLIPNHAELLMGCGSVKFIHRASGGILLVTGGDVAFQDLQDFQSLLSTGQLVTPGHAIWRLQPKRLEWAGQPGEYNCKYRIVHVLSGKFLSADPSTGRIRIISDYTDPDTLWCLRGFGTGGDYGARTEFGEESFVFLEHNRGTWLTDKQGGSAKRLDEEDHVAVPAVLKKRRRDNFVLSMSAVTEDLMQKADDTRDSLQVLRAFADDLRENHTKIAGVDREASYQDIETLIGASSLPLILKQWHQRVTSSLQDLVHTLAVGPGTGAARQTVADYQRLYRESKIIDAVVDALDAINFRMLFGVDGKRFVKRNSTGARLISLGTKCHIFLQRCCRNNTDLQNYVARFKDKLSAHLGGSVKAADTLANMYKDNMNQVQNTTSELIALFTNLIRVEGRYPRFMNFLNTLCGTATRPVPRNQNVLVQELLKESSSVLVRGSKCAGPDSTNCHWEIVWLDCDTDSHETWPCHTLFGRHMDDQTKPDISEWSRSEEFIARNPKITVFIYYVFQLQLFSSLCYGRNTFVQGTLRQASEDLGLGCGFEELLAAVQSTVLPFVLRTACLKLILYLHVDADPYEELQLPRTCRVLQDYSGPWADALRRSVNETKLSLGLVDLRDTLVEYLQRLCKSPKKCTGQSSLTLQVVITLERMLQLGILKMEQTETSRVIDVMMEAMHMLEPSEPSGPGHTIVMETKAHICSALELCLELQNEQHMTTLFKTFATERAKATQPQGARQGAAGLPNTPADGAGSDDSESDLANLICPEEQQEMEVGKGPMNFKMSPPRIRELVSSFLQAKGDNQLFSFDAVSVSNLSAGPVMALVNLYRYDYPVLTEAAARLVEKLLSRRRQLVRCMLQTLIVVDHHTALMYRRCHTLLGLLNREYKWVASTDEFRQQLALQRCMRAFQEMSDTLVTDSRVRVPVFDPEEVQRSATLAALAKDQDNDSVPLLTTSETDFEEVTLSRGRVGNFQGILHDLRASEMALKFLRLPLRRIKKEPVGGKLQMDEAAEPERRKLFGVIYQFMQRLCASEGAGGPICNKAIQSYLVKELPLFMSHIGVLNLNVASTASAMFRQNPELSRKAITEAVIRQFVHLLINYGDKIRTRWLSFLRVAMVVEDRAEDKVVEKPVHVNQAQVLTLVVESEDDLLELCKSEEAMGRRAQAMAGGCHLQNTESGAVAKGSMLAYHRTSIMLLADCTVGGDPTQVVKTSGFLTLDEVLDGATLPFDPEGGTPRTTTRYVASAYWRFLQLVYFATDTKNTQEAVRAQENGIWSIHSSSAPGSPTAAAGPSTPLVRATTNIFRRGKSFVERARNGNIDLVAWVIEEIRTATGEEPSDAFVNSVQYYAAAHLPAFVFPALEKYFRKHYAQHRARLSPDHLAQFDDLVRGLESYIQHIKSVMPGMFGKQRKVALRSALALMEAMVGRSVEGEGGDDRGRSYGHQASTIMSGAVVQTSVVKEEWHNYTVALGEAEGMGVIVCKKTKDCQEVRHVESGQPSVAMASLYMMARLLAQPYHKAAVWVVGGSQQPLGWQMEEVALHLAGLLTEHHEQINWQEETLVKMVRTMAFCVFLDDGRASLAYIRSSWKALSSTDRYQQVDTLSCRTPVHWAQCKYDLLGFTHCAIALMTNSRPSVQLEALRMLIFLLSNGNIQVQDTACRLLSTEYTLSASWFSHVGAVLEHCSDFLKQKAKDTQEVALDADMDFDADEEEDDGGETEEDGTRLNEAHNPFVFAREMVVLFKWLCEGHHMANQMLLQDQPKNDTHRDLVSECVTLLNNLQNMLLESISQRRPHVPDLMVSVFDFLTEACLGPCLPIQIALTLHSPLLLLSNRIFGYVVVEQFDTALVAKTKATILCGLLSLMYGLLEGHADKRVYTRMKDVLDFNAMETQLERLFQWVRSYDGGNMAERSDSMESSQVDRPEYEEADEADEVGGMGSGLSVSASVPDITYKDPSRHSTIRQVKFPGPSVKSVKDPAVGKMSTVGKSVFGTQFDVAGADADSPKMRQEAREAVEKTLLDLLFFVQKLRYVTGGADLLGAPAGDEMRAACKESLSSQLSSFMGARTASIELIWGSNLEKVYFPLTKICQQVSRNEGWQQRVLAFLLALPSDCRANPLRKGIELLDRMEMVVSDLETSHVLEEKYPWAKWTIVHQEGLLRASFFVSLMVLTVMTLTVKDRAWESERPWSFWTSVALCVVQVCLTVLVGISFVARDYRRWRDVREPWFGGWVASRLESLVARPAAALVAAGADADGGGPAGSGEADMMATSREPAATAGSTRLSARAIVRSIPPPVMEQDRHRVWQVLERAIVHSLDLAMFWRAWFVMVLLATAILGVLVTPFFTTFHLSIFFLEFDAGKTLVLALKKAGLPLVKTSLMGLVVIVAFAVGTFVFFTTDENKQACTTLYRCVAVHMIDGFYGDISGIFTDSMSGDVPDSIDEQWRGQIETLYIMAFFIAWAFVLSNIFTGQIVDAFAAIREETNNMEEDNDTKCLVCSLERFDFDKDPETSFQAHTADEHNPLAYVFYLHYLRQTSSTEYKGYDTAVKRMLDKESPADRAAWLPISRSITLDNHADSSAKSVEQSNEKQNDILEYLRSTLRRMDVRVSSIESRLAAIVPAGDGRQSAPGASNANGSSEAGAAESEEDDDLDLIEGALDGRE